MCAGLNPFPLEAELLQLRLGLHDRPQVGDRDVGTESCWVIRSVVAPSSIRTRMLASVSAFDSRLP